MTKILAISGSLRGISINTMVLRAAIRLAPKEVEINLYEDLNDIPPFNPDIEGADFDKPAPEAVSLLRNKIREADGVMIASPEYAHGVSGVLKNAFDWTVGSGDFLDKPIALLNASPRATIAYAALAETIVIMGGVIIEEASLTIPIAENEHDLEGLMAHPDKSAILLKAVDALVSATRRSTITHKLTNRIG